MRITPPEAREALAAVEKVQQRTRRALSLAGGGEIAMVWGLVWMVGYVTSYFLPDSAGGRVWVIVDVVGLLATIVLVRRSHHRFDDPLGPRIGALWISLMAFAALWIWVAKPSSSVDIGFLIATFAMFGYVVMGLWLDLVFLVVGLAVTAIATVGYVWFAPVFDLWMGFLGGGTLLGSGLYIVRRWR